MVLRAIPVLLIAASLFASPAHSLPAQPGTEARQHWECVPVARALSGIQIIGDAHTWWSQAEGRYRRGSTPKRGAVLAFLPHGAMRLGHVAAVSRVIDDRTILVTHSNWSLIGGRRGQIERDVKVIDVSEAGDWSRVRVWFAPLGDLGTTAWPVHGFIYPQVTAPMRLPDGAVIAGGETQWAHSAPPRLGYADMSQLSDRHTGTRTRPTGRLDYLGSMLPRLR